MDIEALRVAVYRSFATTGRAPGVDELGLGKHTQEEVRKGLRELHDSRHIVLEGSDAILMAHPFSAIPLGFSVMGREALWWGGCAWDSFAIPHLLPGEDEVLVATRCPACGTPHAFIVNSTSPPPGDQVAHFLVPVGRMWDDVIHTCGHQRIFCGTRCVGAWLTRTGNEEGYVMGLEQLWRLAARWYEGRLDHGYRRRDPSAAAAYFAEVGLNGPFWLTG